MVGEVGNKANTAPVAVGAKVGAELGNNRSRYIGTGILHCDIRKISTKYGSEEYWCIDLIS